MFLKTFSTVFLVIAGLSCTFTQAAWLERRDSPLQITKTKQLKNGEKYVIVNKVNNELLVAMENGVSGAPLSTISPTWCAPGGWNKQAIWTYKNINGYSQLINGVSGEPLRYNGDGKRVNTCSSKNDPSTYLDIIFDGKSAVIKPSGVREVLIGNQNARPGCDVIFLKDDWCGGSPGWNDQARWSMIPIYNCKSIGADVWTYGDAPRPEPTPYKPPKQPNNAPSGPGGYGY